MHYRRLLQNEMWIVQCSLSHQRESLARCSAHHYGDVSLSDAGTDADVCTAHIPNVLTDSCGVREVEVVYSGMDRIDLDRSHYVETGLLESQTESTGTGKQIDSYGPHALFLFTSLKRIADPREIA